MNTFSFWNSLELRLRPPRRFNSQVSGSVLSEWELWRMVLLCGVVLPQRAQRQAARTLVIVPALSSVIDFKDGARLVMLKRDPVHLTSSQRDPANLASLQPVRRVTRWEVPMSLENATPDG